MFFVVWMVWVNGSYYRFMLLFSVHLPFYVLGNVKQSEIMPLTGTRKSSGLYNRYLKFGFTLTLATVLQTGKLYPIQTKRVVWKSKWETEVPKRPYQLFVHHFHPVLDIPLESVDTFFSNVSNRLTYITTTVKRLSPWGPFYKHGSTLIAAWVINCIV